MLYDNSYEKGALVLVTVLIGANCLRKFVTAF